MADLVIITGLPFRDLADQLAPMQVQAVHRRWLQMRAEDIRLRSEGTFLAQAAAVSEEGWRQFRSFLRSLKPAPKKEGRSS
jgi:hypothetical protein